jgi:hypothetical protein
VIYVILDPKNASDKRSVVSVVTRPHLDQVVLKPIPDRAVAASNLQMSDSRLCAPNVVEQGGGSPLLRLLGILVLPARSWRRGMAVPNPGSVLA